MIRKNCWKIKKFNEKVNGIEDRIWAREITQLGYSVIYRQMQLFTMSMV